VQLANEPPKAPAGNVVRPVLHEHRRCGDGRRRGIVSASGRRATAARGSHGLWWSPRRLVHRRTLSWAVDPGVHLQVRSTSSTEDHSMSQPDEDLRSGIRDKILAGKLPKEHCRMTWYGPGTGGGSVWRASNLS